ncbi:MAG: hypothetical protein JXR97_02120 [Planctomycetes bacterium]|nr:hypothetical protein [Planctomycetota bacterium]
MSNSLRIPRKLKVLILPLLFISWGAAFAAEGAGGWSKEIYSGATPLAIVPPLVDGEAGDLAWKNPAAAIGKLKMAGRNCGDVFFTCDESNLFLMLVTKGKPVAGEDGKEGDRLVVSLGAGAGLKLRISMPAGVDAFCEEWDGWAWAGKTVPSLAVSSSESEDEWITELSLPRAVVSSNTIKPGASVSLYAARAYGGEGISSFRTTGAGLALGVNQALLSFTDFGADGGGAVILEYANWNPSTVKLSLHCELPGKKSPQDFVLSQKTGRQQCRLGLKGKAVDSCALTLETGKDTRFSTCVYRDESSAAFLGKRLVRSGIAQAFLKSGDAPFPAYIPPLRKPDADIVGTVEISNPDGSTDWEALVSLAAKSPFWKDASVYYASMGEVSEAVDSEIGAGLANRAITEALAWDKYTALLRDRGLADHIALGPEVNAARADAFAKITAALAKQKGADQDLRKLLECAVSSWLSAVDSLEADNGNTPYPPGVIASLSDTAAICKSVFTRADYERLLHIAERQIEAHRNIDGSAKFPGLSDAVLFKYIAKLADLSGLDAPNGEVVKKSGAMLEALAKRTLTTGDIPVPGINLFVTGEEVSGWAEKYFRDRESLLRFTPEGQVAFPVNESFPSEGAEEFGGVYTMRAADGGIACSLFAPSAGWLRQSGSESGYGALFLSYKDEIIIGDMAGGGFAPVLVDGNPPLSSSLPASGLPLPHEWMNTGAVDSIAVDWLVYPGQEGKGRCRRRVFLVKGKEGESYIYLCDSVAMPGKAMRLKQYVPLAAGAGGSLRLKTLDGLNIEKPETVEGFVTGKDIAGAGASEMVMIPGEKLSEDMLGGALVLAAENVSRIGKPAPKGGGVIGIDLGEGRTDYLLSDPNRAGLEVAAGGLEVKMDGELSHWRFGKDGLESIALINIESISFGRGAKWRLKFSRPVNATIDLRKDETWAARLSGQEGDSCTLDVEKTISKEVPPLTARVALLAGKVLVFKLL